MAGKGGRSAKGGRGKKGGNPRDPKTIRTVKASELEDISSDEEGEPDTVHVLRALLHGSGSSGSATDFVKKKRQKAEKVHVECDPDQLKLLQTVLKDHKREEEKRKEQEMATAVAEVVLARLGQHDENRASHQVFLFKNWSWIQRQADSRGGQNHCRVGVASGVEA